MIDIRDIVTLDDNNKYIVVSKANYNNMIYYYLIDKNDSSNILFCYENNEKLLEVTDKKLINEIMPLFIKATTNSLKNN